VSARTQDSDGAVDPQGATAAVTIAPVTSGPRLKLSSPWAGPGSSLTVSGAGFQPNESVQLSLPGKVLATTVATATGTLHNTKVGVPSNIPYGTSALDASGQASGREATAALDVTSPWTQFGGDPTRSGYLRNDTVLSRVEVPDKIYRMKPSAVHDTGAPIRSSPAVANNVAYVGNDAGDLEAIDATTGALAWSATTGGAIRSSPALDLVKKLVIVGSDDGSVYAFNLQTGTLAWQRATGGAVGSSPTILNGVAYVGSGSGNLYALNEATGAVLWSAAMSGSVDSSPAVDSQAGLVVAGDSAGDVTAFATSGSQQGQAVWTIKTGGAVANTPTVSGGVVYVGSNDGHEYALSAQTGATVWSTPIGGNPSATAALSGSTLYVGSSDGMLQSLSASNGNVQWQVSTGAAVTGVSATVGLVFTESSNGTVSGYRNSGELTWQSQAGTALSGTPAICDNAVLIGSGNTGLYVYTPFGAPMT
jgi:outer membrane protein assembly factor BamB